MFLPRCPERGRDVLCYGREERWHGSDVRWIRLFCLWVIVVPSQSLSNPPFKYPQYDNESQKRKISVKGLCPRPATFTHFA